MNQRSAYPDWINNGLEHFAQSWPNVEIRIVCGQMFASPGRSADDFTAAFCAGIAQEANSLFKPNEFNFNNFHTYPSHRGFMISNGAVYREMRNYQHHQGGQITPRRVPTASHLIDRPLTKAIIYLPEWERPYQTLLGAHYEADMLGPQAAQNSIVGTFYHEMGHIAHYASMRPRCYSSRLREIMADRNAKAAMHDLGLHEAFNTYAHFGILNIYLNGTSLDDRNYWNWQSVDAPYDIFMAHRLPNELKAVWELKNRAAAYQPEGRRKMLDHLPDIVAQGGFTYPETDSFAQKLLQAVKIFVPAAL